MNKNYIPNEVIQALEAIAGQDNEEVLDDLFEEELEEEQNKLTQKELKRVDSAEPEDEGSKSVCVPIKMALYSAANEIQDAEQWEEYTPCDFIEYFIAKGLREYLERFLLTEDQKKYQKANDSLALYILRNFKKIKAMEEKVRDSKEKKEK